METVGMSIELTEELKILWPETAA